MAVLTCGVGVGSGEDCGGPNGGLCLGWGACPALLGSYAAAEIQAGHRPPSHLLDCFSGLIIIVLEGDYVSATCAQ
jgi:hypothetical protein